MKNDPENHTDIPPEKLAELLEFNRRRLSPDPRQRPGIDRSIRNARSTLFLNLIIEIAAAMVLLVGMAYTVKFLYARRAFIEPAKFNLYLQALGFFTVGWLTYVGFKVRAKYSALRNHGKAQENGRNRET